MRLNPFHFLPLLLLPWVCSAATYNVSTSGNDSNNGITAPWKTITHALGSVYPGDVITVADGTYHETPTVTASGTAGAPITIQASSSAAILYTGEANGDVWHARGNWINYKGLTFHCVYSSSGSGYYPPGSTFCYSTWIQGSHQTFSGCTWENMSSQAAHWGDGDHADYDAVVCDGTNNSIINCVVRNLGDMDAFGCGYTGTSSNFLIKNCDVSNIANDNYNAGPHSDFFQDGGNNTTNFIVDGCYVHACTGSTHIGVFTSNITLRNCVFNTVGLGGYTFYSGSGCSFLDCTFYNCNPWVLGSGNSTIRNNLVYPASEGQPNGGLISNNIFTKFENIK